MPLTLIDRFQPALREKQQAAIEAGQLRKRDELAVLELEQLQPLARLSLLLLLAGGVFFGILDIAAYFVQTHRLIGQLGFLEVLFWLLINAGAYIIMLPLHELVHGLAFAFWGGKPYFGTKLPLALYCGARNQLFRRNQYLVVGLAPLVFITLAGMIFTLVAPGLASYALFAFVGNISGSASDVWTAARILRQPASVLVEDTDAGYRTWEVSV